jgi:hypothetical protein
MKQLARALVATSLLLFPTLSAHALAEAPLAGLHAVVYKSPTCGCCTSYVDYLRRHGVTVETRNVDDASLAQVKADNSVPHGAESCHTVLIDGYVVEGHVPLVVLEKLLTERPEVDGVSLPGMPTGVPGMPGPAYGPIEVISFDDGSTAPFLSL